MPSGAGPPGGFEVGSVMADLELRGQTTLQPSVSRTLLDCPSEFRGASEPEAPCRAQATAHGPIVQGHRTASLPVRGPRVLGFSVRLSLCYVNAWRLPH